MPGRLYWEGVATGSCNRQRDARPDGASREADVFRDLREQNPRVRILFCA